MPGGINAGIILFVGDAANGWLEPEPGPSVEFQGRDFLAPSPVAVGPLPELPVSQRPPGARPPKSGQSVATERPPSEGSTTQRDKGQ